MRVRRVLSRCVLVVGLVMVAATTAGASVILTYTGSTFGTNTNGPFGSGTPSDTYASTDRVTVTLTLGAELGASLANADVSPTSFTIADGVNVITQATATSSRFKFTTDASKNIVGWDVDVQEQTTTYFRWMLTFKFPGNALDEGFDTTCGPGSTTVSCVLGARSYQQSALSEVPGAWAYERPVTAPEPLTAALVGVGLIAVGARRSRRL